MKTEIKYVNIRLRRGTYDLIKEYAQRENYLISQFINMLVQNYAIHNSTSKRGK